jgi:hypothetical protein
MLVKMVTIAQGPDFAADAGEDKVVGAALGQALVAGRYAKFVCGLWTPPAASVPASGPASRRAKATAGPRETR